MDPAIPGAILGLLIAGFILLKMIQDNRES